MFTNKELFINDRAAKLGNEQVIKNTSKVEIVQEAKKGVLNGRQTGCNKGYCMSTWQPAKANMN